MSETRPLLNQSEVELRDDFAMRAMQILIRQGFAGHSLHLSWDFGSAAARKVAILADQSYKIADAMMARRKSSEPSREFLKNRC